MKDKIIEILKKQFADLFERKPSVEEAKWIKTTAADLSAAFEEMCSPKKREAFIQAVFEEKFRDELIKFVNINFTDLIGDGTIFVDEYLKSREKCIPTKKCPYCNGDGQIVHDYEHGEISKCVRCDGSGTIKSREK